MAEINTRWRWVAAKRLAVRGRIRRSRRRMWPRVVGGPVGAGRSPPVAAGSRAQGSSSATNASGLPLLCFHNGVRGRLNPTKPTPREVPVLTPRSAHIKLEIRKSLLAGRAGNLVKCTICRQLAAKKSCLLALLFLCLAAAAPVLRADEPVKDQTAEFKATPEQEAFFEQKVRPLLAARCFECHGDKKQEGGLRLDSRTLATKGNESGPAIVPGKPEQSRLVEVIGYQDAIRMPPKQKLADAEIAVLTEWVKLGAPFPAAAAAAGPALGESATPAGIVKARATHWSYQPILRSEPPAIKNTTWGAGAIDRFILAKLEEQGLAPSPPADRRTLLRRASFDLVGLPPTADEVAAFVNDKSERAFASAVDRLLASGHYGERWGRHWLDVARYADTKGYVFTEERKYPFSYTYRDYVIRAMNSDLPFDRFILEQLAADQLATGDDKAPLAAMGFLTLGRRFGNNQNDIIDDRIDVVSRGLLGLTTACARCHDHKFDPIPTDDYYSLYGIFASSVEPADLPLIGQPVMNDAYREYEQQLAKLEGAWTAMQTEKLAALIDELRSHTTDFLAVAADNESQSTSRCGPAGDRFRRGPSRNRDALAQLSR